MGDLFYNNTPGGESPNYLCSDYKVYPGAKSPGLKERWVPRVKEIRYLYHTTVINTAAVVPAVTPLSLAMDDIYKQQQTAVLEGKGTRAARGDAWYHVGRSRSAICVGSDATTTKINRADPKDLKKKGGN